jgi:O-antigen ligase
VSSVHRVVAFVWLVTIGSHFAGYYTMAANYETPYLGAVVFMGTGYFFFFLRGHLWNLLACKDYTFVLFLLMVPLAFFLLAERTIVRSAYTTVVSVTMVFVTSSLLFSRSDLKRTLMAAACVIVFVGVALNLYELLIHSNTWSIAPGRSAGLYVNPNISGAVLLGYGLFFLSRRTDGLTIADLLLMAVLTIGVFATFSRSSILALLVLLSALVFARMQRGDLLKVFGGIAMVAIAGGVFAAYVLRNVDLSDDAAIRITSLLTSWGVGDYEQDRMYAIDASMELILKDPLLGAGAGTMYALPEGPHNMFVAMMLDYGLLGLLLYVVLIVRLVLVALRGRLSDTLPLWVFIGWIGIFSLVSHNLLDYVPYIPLFAFALVNACRIQKASELQQR